jgi:pimeloyl-ACP methyl ester carboxylesterase
VYNASVTRLCLVLTSLVAMSACDPRSIRARGRGATEQDPQDAAAPDPEVVRISTSDGWLLVGDVRVRARGGLAVVFVHQLASNRGEWHEFSSRLAAAPAGQANPGTITTLSIDLRGHGESVASPEGPMRWTSFANSRARWMGLEHDVAAAVDYVRQRAGTTNIVVVGSSIGATAAALYAARAGAPVTGLVLISPGLEYRGIDLVAPLQTYVGRGGRVLLITAAGDTYSADTVRALQTRITTDADTVQTERYENASAHGVSLGAQGIHPEMWTTIERFIKHSLARL